MKQCDNCGKLIWDDKEGLAGGDFCKCSPPCPVQFPIPLELLAVDNNDVFLSQVKSNIQELKDCHCPEKIVDMLEEWLLNLLYDRNKYNEWTRKCEVNQITE